MDNVETVHSGRFLRKRSITTTNVVYYLQLRVKAEFLIQAENRVCKSLFEFKGNPEVYAGRRKRINPA